ELENRHAVSDGTKRALLAAMGLRAETTSRALESLGQLIDETELRPLPRTLVLREGEPFHLPIRMSPQRSLSAMRGRIEGENGKSAELDSPADGEELSTRRASDGRTVWERNVRLPALAPGMYRVTLDGSDIVSTLTIAPNRCYLPDSFRNQRRLFG